MPEAEEVDITAAEIAELAHVSRPAVSNWRRRYQDFPAAVAVAPGGGDLFRLSEVKAWLQQRGRHLRDHSNAEALVWNALDALRTLMAPEELVEVAAACLALVTVSGAAAWRHLSPSGLDMAIRDELSRLARAQPDIATSFESLWHLDPAVAPLLWALSETLAAGGDPARLFEALLQRRTRLRVYWSGEHVSSPEVTALMVQLADVRGGLVFDPSAGEGGFLLAAMAACRESGTTPRLVGQEANGHTRRIARLRCLVHGVDAEIRAGDSLNRDAVPDLRADVVLCEPPFGVRWRPDAARWEGRLLGDPYGAGSIDLAWALHAIDHLDCDGRAYLLLPTGSLYRGGSDGRIRHQLVERGCVEAVIALPAGLVRSSRISSSLWVLRPPATGDLPPVLLVDAATEPSQRGVGLDGARVDRMVETLRRFRADPSGFRAAEGFSVSVPVSDLLTSEAELLPRRRVLVDTPLASIRARLHEAIAEFAAGRAAMDAVAPVPRFGAALRGPARSKTTVRELAAKGVLSVVRGVPLPQEASSPGGAPALVPPWRRIAGDPSRTVDLDRLARRPLLTRAGDVVVVVTGTVPRAFVDTVGGHVLPESMLALGLRDNDLDPVVLAALLSAPVNVRYARGATIQRVDVMDVEVPLLTQAETQSLRRILLAIQGQEEVAEQLHRSAGALRSELMNAVVSGRASVTLDEAQHDAGASA
jgi:hypothetical protein